MATLARRDATAASTANTATYVSASFTPTVGDLLVVFVTATASLVAAPTLTASANGITFTRVHRQVSGVGSHIKCIFVADQLVPASPSAMTVTFDVTSDPATGCGIVVMAATGMTKVGSAAVVQVVGADDNHGGGAPASVTFGAAPLTTNPVLCHLMSNSSTAPSFNHPTGMTEYADLAWATPSSSYGVAGAASGWTATTVSTSANQGVGAFSAIELDASAGGVTGTGSLTASGATLSGSGSLSLTGTAALVAAGAVLAGTATLGLGGTGAVTASAATLSGAGTVNNNITGTGSLTAGNATLSGSGALQGNGAGALTATEATLAGAGALRTTGSGALTASTATLNGAASLRLTGTGSVTASGATLAGSGNIGSVVGGTGALTASQAVLSGAGQTRLTGTGSLTPSDRTLTGSGTVRLDGAGALTATPATLAGAGDTRVSGSGALTSSGATLAGTGTVSGGTPVDPTPPARTRHLDQEPRAYALPHQPRVAVLTLPTPYRTRTLPTEPREGRP